MVKWLDECPLWLKIIFALPVVDLVWAVYRLVKGATQGKIWTLVGGILWIIPGAVFCWLIDIISICVKKHVVVLA